MPLVNSYTSHFLHNHLVFVSTDKRINTDNHANNDKHVVIVSTDKAVVNDDRGDYGAVDTNHSTTTSAKMIVIVVAVVV